MFLELTRAELAGFDGVKFIPDVHGNIKEFAKAVEDAEQKNLFIIQDGDLIDRGPAPSACVELMRKIEDEKRGRFKNGNHEVKFWQFVRYGQHNSFERRRTFTDFYRRKRTDTLEWYIDRIENGYYWARAPRCVIAHGGFHPEMIAPEPQITYEVKERAIRGIEKGLDHWGLPIRDHAWIDEIPDGLTVLVGHDIVSYKAPVVKYGRQGGCAVFCDNGADSGNKLSHINLTFEDLGLN